MMKLSLMTLGCPAWDLETVCQRGGEYGFDGIDFRGIQGDLDVTRLPAFTTGVASTVRLLADNGLVTSGISSSISVCDLEKRQACLDEAKRTIAVAVALGAKNVRVFGNGSPDKIGYEESAKIGSDCVEAILAIPGANQLSWNFETHDHWISSVDCLRLLNAVTNPAFGACWDLGHTKRVANESAEQTLAAIGSRLRYAHVKDAVQDKSAAGDGWRYVLPGQGVLELDHAIGALKKFAYDGWLMFEHEKRWHPELEEPEVAFPAFVKWARRVLAA